MNKWQKLISILFIAILIILFAELVFYFIWQNRNEKIVKTNINSQNEEMQRLVLKKAFNSLIVPKVLIYKYKLKDEKSKMDNQYIKLDSNEKWNSRYALENADVLLGYGIYKRIGYEANFSNYYKKPSYAFNCNQPLNQLKATTPLCKFEPECIATKDFKVNYDNNEKFKKRFGRIHKFSDKIAQLNLKDKKLFINIDIGGAELLALPEILEHTENITGMTIKFYPTNAQDLIEMSNLISKINKDFILISRNTTYTSGLKIQTDVSSWIFKGDLNDEYVLSYINKNLLKSYNISWEQNTEKLYEKFLSFTFPYDKDLQLYEYKNNCKYINKNKTYKVCHYAPSHSNINKIVIIAEKLKAVSPWKQQFKE